MRIKGERYLAFLFCMLVLAIGGDVVKGAGAPAQTLNMPEALAGVSVDDDYEPDVTDRVARISFLRGEARIKRAESDTWEKVTLNLPLVEGDEISTEGDSRVEIQFDKYKHLRLAENSFIKIISLKDAGIALSISLGSLSVHISSFDIDKSYFEIDAPKTTMAVQRAGTYRIDAGSAGDVEIRVAATDGGEARVYTDNAGFAVKNGRSASIQIEGPRSGEYVAADAMRSIDEFDTWAADRDTMIAKQLKDAYYAKYYDDDIYGADDLGGYGDWVYTPSYGYVWRPSRSSISGYADWSPYRYGNWRWMPPYGWVWVNDEPWGWATYHHGRWFYDAGYWYWSPYGYYRPARSWWSPALVVISIFGNNVCWYPLNYHHAYYNYNWNYNSHHGGHHNNNDGPNHPTGGPRPTPTPVSSSTALAQNPKGPKTPPLGVPTGAVVTSTMDDFGSNVKGIKKAPLTLATAVLTKEPTDVKAAPELPVYAAVTKRATRDIVTERPKLDTVAVQTKVGAAPRSADAPLDKELRNTRVFGGRPPLTDTIKVSPDSVKQPTGDVRSPETRKTGAVDRPPVVKQNNDPALIRQVPVETKPETKADEPQNTPVRVPRNDPPVKQESPRYDPPPVRETPRYDVPKPTPRYDPPPRQDPTPKPQPAPRSDPPPKSEPKPDKPRDDGPVNKKKDGR